MAAQTSTAQTATTVDSDGDTGGASQTTTTVS